MARIGRPQPWTSREGVFIRHVRQKVVYKMWDAHAERRDIVAPWTYREERSLTKRKVSYGRTKQVQASDALYDALPYPNKQFTQDVTSVGKAIDGSKDFVLALAFPGDRMWNRGVSLAIRRHNPRLPRFIRDMLFLVFSSNDILCAIMVLADIYGKDWLWQKWPGDNGEALVTVLASIRSQPAVYDYAVQVTIPFFDDAIDAYYEEKRMLYWDTYAPCPSVLGKHLRSIDSHYDSRFEYARAHSRYSSNSYDNYDNDDDDDDNARYPKMRLMPTTRPVDKENASAARRGTAGSAIAANVSGPSRRALNDTRSKTLSRQNR